jgi:hypothetical protein
MTEFDRGPSGSLARVFDEVPGPPVKEDFWFDWGPVFYRGRLDGSARLLCIASDPGPTERIAGRSLVGNAGQRVQGLLAKLGLTRSYLCLNAGGVRQGGGVVRSRREADSLPSDEQVEGELGSGSLPTHPEVVRGEVRLSRYGDHGFHWRAWGACEGDRPRRAVAPALRRSSVVFGPPLIRFGPNGATPHGFQPISDELDPAKRVGRPVNWREWQRVSSCTVRWTP